MWSTFALSPETTYAIRFPQVSAYIHTDGPFWRVATVFTGKPQRPAPAAPVKATPKDLAWRYSALLGAAELTVRPMLSPRPYEVEIAPSVSILPGVEFDGYVFLPLHAELVVSQGPILASLPLRPRKTSWFGSSEGGVLCDAIVSSFGHAREVGDFLAAPSPDVAVCPVTIRNEMQEGMDLARLCIPTDSLSIFGREGVQATDRVFCEFTSDGIRITPRRGMDPLLGKMEVLHAARQTPEAKFFARGVDILRHITGI